MSKKVEQASAQTNKIKAVNAEKSEKDNKSDDSLSENSSNKDEILKKSKKDMEQSKSSKKIEPLKEIEEKFKTSQKECRETYDRLLRTSAEFDNYKKRTTREMGELRKYANEALIKEMLPILDNLERAIQSSEESEQVDNGVVEGVEMTLKEILKVLNKYGVIQVETKGRSFDPNFHQAVMQQENDEHADNTVLSELQKGYLMHDRLIRPAMVVVSKAKPKTDQVNESNSNDDSDAPEETEIIED